MQYDPEKLVLEPTKLRERAARCFRLARTLVGGDAEIVEALGHEYLEEAKRLESAAPKPATAVAQPLEI
jgi:hypothetical protein